MLKKAACGTNLTINFATDSRINVIQKSVFSEISKKKRAWDKTKNQFCHRLSNKRWEQRHSFEKILNHLKCRVRKIHLVSCVSASLSKIQITFTIILATSKIILKTKLKAEVCFGFFYMLFISMTSLSNYPV